MPASSGFGVSPPPLLPLFIMQTRIASLLEVGLHFKGAPCLRCLHLTPPPLLRKPQPHQHPKSGASAASLGWGNQGTVARQPHWETNPALCDISPTELSTTLLLSCPLSVGSGTHALASKHCPASVYPLTTPRETGRRAPARDTHPAAGSAAPRLAPSLAGELDEPDPLPRAPGGLIGSLLARSRRELGQVPGGISKA